MNLLVTGGAGFIGSCFVRSVLGGTLPGLSGARVTVLDKLTYAGSFASLGPVAEHDRLDFVPGDITDAALADTVVRGHDAIVHFAAESHADFAATNVLGTQTLLDAARRHGTGRFVQVSTDEVYGPISTGAWTQRSPVAPESPYAASKAAADLLALAAHRTHGLPVVVTRGARTYGPYQHPEKLIPHFVTSLLDGRPAPAPGDGDRVRDWVHVDDHCRGVALALQEGTPGEVYHFGGAAGLSDRKLTAMLLSACNADGNQVTTVEASENQDRGHALGYRPRVDLKEGLADTVQWYRDNEEWWRPLVTD